MKNTVKLRNFRLDIIGVLSSPAPFGPILQTMQLKTSAPSSETLKALRTKNFPLPPHVVIFDNA